jgi:hypothetical protein
METGQRIQTEAGCDDEKVTLKMKPRFRKLLTAAVLLLALGILGLIGWFVCSPQVISESRVDRVGAAKIVEEFDDWLAPTQLPDTGSRDVPLDSLPASIRKLGGNQAVLRNEGLYLQIRKRFVEADHILLRSTQAFPVMLSSGDPQFIELRPRIYLVRIKG